MTNLLEPIIGEPYTTIFKDTNHNNQHPLHRNVLRSKENIYKHKCNKILKRKLKKYKLRQDGKEDQDIIDVSDILVSSLLIRSPNKAKDSAELELEKFRPKNYLFRMVRRKQTLKSAKSSKDSDVDTKALEGNGVSQLSPASEEKKQKNAFKMLMDSRNKSLGSNSPGKEKPLDEIDVQQITEKKSIKAKRSLILQKMAEEKGSLKKAEIEEQHEKYIKKKMEKRAKKLKSMIMNKEPKMMKDDSQKIKTTSKKISKVNSQEECSLLDCNETEKKVLNEPVKALQLISIFSESIDRKISPEKRLIPKEDEEFLKKLSPSLRKKESMLSYFKKVDKDNALVDSENDNTIIKVKLGSKSKKRGRKKKLSLNRDIESLCEVSENNTQIVEPCIDITVDEVIKPQKNDIPLYENPDKTDSGYNSKERRKRKRVAEESTPCCDSSLIYNSSMPTDNTQPKRTVKRPVKYNENVTLSSSDEELHIFTPKKKKHLDQKNNSVLNSTVDLNIINIKKNIGKSKPIKKLALVISNKTSSNIKKPTEEAKPPKSVKLAPIFTKAQPDPIIEAKQKFLQSGVPEKLKKVMLKQKNSNSLSNSFPIVVHVQQCNKTFSEPPKLNLSDEICFEEINLKIFEEAFSKILNLSIPLNHVSMHIKNNVSTQTVLRNLKETYPRFPVYRTYKLLRGKKKGEFKDSKFFSSLDNSIEILNCSIDTQNDNPDQLTWSDKYKPLSGNEIIGNFENIKELKKWLITWTENDNKSKVINARNSDSSDYYQSEPDSRDSMKSNDNLLILSGPVGSGKTSCVYAVAAELSMKVIEVNASSKRTGKIMLQDLQEATQSHKVNRGTGSNENSQKSQEIIEPLPEIKMKKRGRPKKVLGQLTPKKIKEKPEVIPGPSVSQESSRTAMSLILIDDADIVFDQDDGFCSAIMQLVQSSKRPVILITGSLSLPHLQRFLQSSKILKMQPLLPNMLGTWLDLMCLADSGTCWPGLGAKLLNFFKGDMRKTINCLQFYVGSQEQVSGIEGSQIDSQNSDVIKFNADNENSCMSWADRDAFDEKNINDLWNTESQSVWDTFVNEHIHLKHTKYPLKMFNVWWSVPKILNIESNLSKTNNIEKTNENKKSLELIGNVLDTISTCDYFSHIRPEKEVNITSHPWYDSECNSVSELENFDYYDQKYETNNELCYELVKGSITTAQENMQLENRFNLDFPGMSAKRQRDRIISRHNNLTSYLSPQSSLDRKALALDYWSSCRAICRIEKSKTDSNSKRNNRFCHYLKSLSMLCKSDSFDILANSLNPNN